MWSICLAASLICIILSAVASLIINNSRFSKVHKFNLFYALAAAMFVGAIILFFPIHYSTANHTLLGAVQAVLVSVFNSIQLFAAGCEFGVIEVGLSYCPDNLYPIYNVIMPAIFVVAPLFTFGFVLSIFKNLSAYIAYAVAFYRDTYVFSELNEKSLALASDISAKHKKALIVFTEVFKNDENSIELVETAKKINAILFKKDILDVNFNIHRKNRPISFFAIGVDETENLNKSLSLIEKYKGRKNTDLYIFSTKIESELIISSVDKGNIKVRRINEVQSLINRILYERGEVIFDTKNVNPNGTKDISALVVGLGNHGTEMLKALSWFGQMDGYNLYINAFDKDVLAKDKIELKAPELISAKYNGVRVEGEAFYSIEIHSDMNVQTTSFFKKISEIKNVSYVFISLGNDDLNIECAINLRTHFERMRIHPIIQAVVYNSNQIKALSDIKNFKNQKYDIEFIGDIESSYAEDVIIDSELEAEALARHLKWGSEEDFWNYEYNYRSSTASAIHMRARIKCAIPGSDKREEDLTTEEAKIIEVLEHKRWNAYMRSEGYVFSGSKDPTSRNDLAKMHHDLVNFGDLSPDEKLKDRKVGTK